MPTDTTPDPRDMERMPEAQQIPKAEREVAGKPDIARRPPLPDHPGAVTSEVEDESADPVVESGPLGHSDGELNRR
jgi:hypothetical protein